MDEKESQSNKASSGPESLKAPPQNVLFSQTTISGISMAFINAVFSVWVNMAEQQGDELESNCRIVLQETCRDFLAKQTCSVA